MSATDPRTADRDSLAEARGALRNVREVRTSPFTEFEIREAENGTGTTELVFTGFASTTSDDDSAAYEMEDFLGPWRESVTPGAFRNTLNRNADVTFLLNHAGMTLARTKSGSLQLSEVMTGSPTGLHVEARLDPGNMYVQAIRSAIARNDLDEMSFAFRVVRQEWSDSYDRRWINEVNMDHGDVSLCNFGANGHTGGTVAIRGLADVVADLALDPRLVLLDAVDRRHYLAGLSELRAGKTLSADTIATLQQVLDLISSADDAVDEAQPLLAELMGVPNPDEGDDDKGGAADEPTTGDTDQLAAKVKLEVLSLPNHIYDAKARLAALRG